jgi:hypothetical protein
MNGLLSFPCSTNLHQGTEMAFGFVEVFPHCSLREAAKPMAVKRVGVAAVVEDCALDEILSGRGIHLHGVAQKLPSQETPVARSMAHGGS